jgi:hypothetical protein
MDAWRFAAERRYLGATSYRFGSPHPLHRQDAAMMTCFTPSASRGDYVDFIDGAPSWLRLGGFCRLQLAEPDVNLGPQLRY